MFPVGHLPDALLSAVINQLGFCELLSLQRVSKTIRSTINKRGLWPRKWKRMRMNVCTPKPGFIEPEADGDVEGEKLWARGVACGVNDLDGWTLQMSSFGMPMKMSHNTVGNREFPLSYGNLLKLLPASTALIGDFVALSFDYRTTEMCPNAPQEVDRWMKRSGPCDVLPFLRWPAAAEALFLHLEKNISNFHILQKLQGGFRHGTDKVEFRWINSRVRIRHKPDDRIRCRRCMQRYGNAAPWDCNVCGQAWANWSTLNTSARLPELAFAGICDFSVNAVANMADVAFCPMRAHLPGRMLRISGRCRHENFDLAVFTHDFAQRVDRVHGGRMELLDEQAADAKALKQWLSQRLGVKKETMDRRLYRISVYGKEFLAAFLSAKRNFFAKYGKHVTDEKQLKKKQANFLVAIFDV